MIAKSWSRTHLLPSPPTRRSLPQKSFATSADTAGLQEEAKGKLLKRLEQSRGNGGNDESIKGLVKQLIATPTSDAAAKTFRLGLGQWEVFCAPHISGLSQTFGTTFDPIRYTLKEGGVLVSNVKYSSSLFKEGWLSASGTMEASGSNTLQIHFDKFWVDFGSQSLREEHGQGEEKPWDRFVMVLGKLGFISAFSFFPVDYVDESIAVFNFPPLRSFIAVHNISKQPET